MVLDEIRAAYESGKRDAIKKLLDLLLMEPDSLPQPTPTLMPPKKEAKEHIEHTEPARAPLPKALQRGRPTAQTVIANYIKENSGSEGLMRKDVQEAFQGTFALSTVDYVLSKLTANRLLEHKGRRYYYPRRSKAKNIMPEYDASGSEEPKLASS